MKNRFAAAICALGVMVSGSAQAATFNLFYDSGQGEVVPNGFNVLEAVITGDLGLDGNTVTVTGISNVTFDGLLRTITFFDSSSNQISSTGTAPTLTLDGSVLDFIGCQVGPACTDAFRFDTTADFFEGEVYRGGLSFGGGETQEVEEDINASFSLTATAIPLPAPAFLLLAGIGVFAVARGRSRTA
ncbi:MAG: VPLPA-CTERM sorting domain-containing protein [Pseudomonadota bacterium]